jgi:hypothetical protein
MKFFARAYVRERPSLKVVIACLDGDTFSMDASKPRRTI